MRTHCRRWAFINKNKKKIIIIIINKNYPMGEKQEQGKSLARQGWTGQDRAGYIQGEMMTVGSVAEPNFIYQNVMLYRARH